MGKPNTPTIDYPNELSAAQATLTKSRSIADTIIPKNARSDLSYWFAELYYYITLFEIQDRNAFDHPAFVMHFIPIFYDMYAVPAQQYSNSGATISAEAVAAMIIDGLSGVGWATGFAKLAAAGAEKAASSRAKIPDHWQEHFSTTSQIVDPSQLYPYIKAVTSSLVSGVKAHIQGDMAGALEKAYRTYTEKYSNVPPFDRYYADFFDKNKPIFVKVRVSLINELVNRGLGFAAFGRSVDPNFASKTADFLNQGLKIEEIYRWRDDAWKSAKSKLRS